MAKAYKQQDGDFIEVDLDTIEVPNCPVCRGTATLVPVGICANPLKPYFAPTWTLLLPKCKVCGNVQQDWEEALFPEIESGSLTVIESGDKEDTESS